MPRLRTLKPSFFTDADLCALPPLHRLAFEGLWVHADREGRLEDKPRELKIQILPYDECDFDGILAVLARPKGDGRPGFITRYRVGNKRLICIEEFPEHQNPHPKEAKSGLPGKDAAEQRLDIVEPRKGSGEPGGAVVLGSGSLVVASGNPPRDAAAASPISAMSATVLQPESLRDLADRRAPDSPLRTIPAEPGAFRDRVEAEFLKQRGAAYDLTHDDETAVGLLLGKGPDEEVHRRWAIGLRRTVYPRVNTLGDLVKHWNACASEQAGATGSKPKDITRGTVTAESQKDLHGPAGEHSL